MEPKGVRTYRKIADSIEVSKQRGESSGRKGGNRGIRVLEVGIPREIGTACDEGKP